MKDDKETGVCQPSVRLVPPGLVPFKPGFDPRRGKGIDAKTARARKRLAKLDDKAIKTLEAMFDSDDPKDRREAVKFWGKYRLPVPTEKPNADTKTPDASMPTEVAAKLAAMDA